MFPSHWLRLVLVAFTLAEAASRIARVGKTSGSVVRKVSGLTEEGLQRLDEVHSDTNGRYDLGLSFEPKLRNLNWLHIPKAGTTFIATIWNYACGLGGKDMRQLDLRVDVKAGLGCGKCYDFALMDRYPRAEYCTPGVLANTFTTQHAPTSLNSLRLESTVGFFRKPGQRLISGHRDGLHSSGFPTSEYSALQEACRSKDAGCYARFPGIAGCATRMLTGAHCAESDLERKRTGQTFDGGRSRVTDAIEALSHMEFVGLTEEWDESICLFHLMFGVPLDPHELVNYHPAGLLESEIWDESELSGFIDEADEKVYAAAKDIFAQQRQRYVDVNSTACSTLGFSHLAPSRTQEFSCAALGRQCGRTGDLDCGVCPKRRLKGSSSSVESSLHCSAAGECLFEGWSPQNKTFQWYYPSGR